MASFSRFPRAKTLARVALAHRTGERAAFTGHASLRAFDAITGKQLYDSGSIVDDWTHYSGTGGFKWAGVLYDDAFASVLVRFTRRTTLRKDVHHAIDCNGADRAFVDCRLSYARFIAALLAFLVQAQPLPPPFPRDGATKLIENDRVIGPWDAAWLRRASSDASSRL